MPKNKNKRLEKKHHRQLGSGKILLLMSGSVAFIAAIHAACKGNILKLAQHDFITLDNESSSPCA